MSDVMSFAELAEQYVELLPARTVLSLLHAGIDGAPGTPGAAGSSGQSAPGTTMWALLGSYDHSDSGTGPASSKAS